MYKTLFSLAIVSLVALIQAPAGAFQHVQGSGSNSEERELNGQPNYSRALLDRHAEQRPDDARESDETEARNFADAELALVRQRNPDPIQEATQKLKGAENSQDKEQAIDTIRDELGQQYDNFLAANEKQVEELQQRLDKLREQLVRRREAKEKMVDLELERVVNESEGLIWPDRGGRNRPSGWDTRSGGPDGFPSRSNSFFTAPRPPSAEVPREPREPRNAPELRVRSGSGR